MILTAIIQYILALLAATLLTFSAIVATNPTFRGARALSLLIAATALWLGSTAATAAWATPFAAMLGFASGAIASAAHVCFITAFTHAPRRRLLCSIIGAIGLFFTLASFWHGAFVRTLHVAPSAIAVTPGPLYFSFIGYVLLCGVISLAYILRQRSTASDAPTLHAVTTRLLVIFAGTITLSFIVDVILPTFLHITSFTLVGPIITGCTVLIATLLFIRAYALSVHILSHPVVRWILYSAAIAFFYSGARIAIAAPLAPALCAGVITLLGVAGGILTVRLQRTIPNTTLTTVHRSSDRIAALLADHTHTLPDNITRLLETIAAATKATACFVPAAACAPLCAPQALDNQACVQDLRQQRFPPYPLFCPTVTVAPTRTHRATLAWCRAHRITALAAIHGGHTTYYGILLLRGGAPLTLTAQKLLFEEAAIALTTLLMRDAALPAQQHRPRERDAALHRIHTPLTVARGHLYLLHQHIAKQLQRVDDAMQRIGHDVAQHLAASIPTAPQHRAPSSATTDLSAATHAHLAEIAPALAQHRFSVTTDIQQHIIGTIAADDYDTVLRNLNENALKYAADDAVRQRRLTVTLQQRGERALLTIADNGIGITRADHDRIFHGVRTARARATASGSGHGLRECRQILQRYGGTIAAHPQRSGMRFTIHIPLAVHDATP